MILYDPNNLLRDNDYFRMVFFTHLIYHQLMFICTKNKQTLYIVIFVCALMCMKLRLYWSLYSFITQTFQYAVCTPQRISKPTGN